MGGYEDRLRRERDFHNNDLWRNNRAGLDKYRSIFTKKWGTLAFRDKIIAENANPASTILLDYGCGDGKYLTGVHALVKEGVGIDISQKEIEAAEAERESSGIGNLKFYVMDAMNTSFKDGEFDIIHGNAILHHLDLEKSVAEIKRILKERGIAVFIEPLSTNPVIELYRKLTPKLRTPDEQPFRRKELALLARHFKNIKIKYFSFLTLLAVIFRKSGYFENILGVLYKLDNVILSAKSPLKFLAWVCVIELRK
jgi:ubiquinone/menaquinone biosynthesis C-methylase UbiE